MTSDSQWGGPRPKVREDDARGGPRPGAGRPVKTFRLKVGDELVITQAGEQSNATVTDVSREEVALQTDGGPVILKREPPVHK